MKKIFCLILAVLMITLTAGSAFALEKEDTFREASTRGSNPPGSSSTTTLPYTASGNIYSKTYTNYLFKPSGSDIAISFRGTCSSQVNYTLTLYNSSNVEQPTTLVFFPGASGNVSTSYSWSGLNSNTYYYGSIAKSNSSVLASVRGEYS